MRINQLGATLWEVLRDWRGLWVLVVVYFVLAVMSALGCSGEERMASRIIVFILVVAALPASIGCCAQR